MNIKQFLVAKICQKLPEDISYIVWTNVKNGAATKIAQLYYFRICRNLDIFVNFREITDYCMLIYGPNGEELYDMPTTHWANLHNYLPPFTDDQDWTIEITDYTKMRIAKYINYILKNNLITYKYIQSPGSWIECLDNITQMFSKSILPAWQPPISFWTDIENLINLIRTNNEQYILTGIEWWNYY